MPFFVGLTNSKISNDERLALFNIDEEFIPRRQTIEIGRCRQRRNRPVHLMGLRIIGEDLGIHQVGGQLIFADFPVNRLLDFRPLPHPDQHPLKARLAAPYKAASPFRILACSSAGQPPGETDRDRPASWRTTESGKGHVTFRIFHIGNRKVL